jgi:hypothetical protein
MLASSSCTCVLLRKLWTLPYVTWRICHSDTFPQFITSPPFFLLHNTQNCYPVSPLVIPGNAGYPCYLSIIWKQPRGILRWQRWIRSFWEIKKLHITDKVLTFMGHATWRMHDGIDISHLARCVTEKGYLKCGTEKVINTKLLLQMLHDSAAAYWKPQAWQQSSFKTRVSGMCGRGLDMCDVILRRLRKTHNLKT